jgi:hypothetical protein
MTNKKRSKSIKKRKRWVERCKIPPPPADKRFLSSYTLNNRADEHSIREYVEWQARDERVEHAEKVKMERCFDRIYDCWDVHTDKNRWWVITSPTNLYSQQHFPSLDYTLSFHVGVMARVAARDSRKPQDAQRKRLSSVWRRWEDAAEALDVSEEAEEFQAIGMRCREAMIQLVRSLAAVEMIPAGQDAPKRSDVVGWSEHIANTIAAGSNVEHIRGYLKTTSKLAWQAVNWLTHCSSAARGDAAFVLDAAQTVISAFSRAIMRFESDAPDRCPVCGSYRISVGYNPELDPPYVSACEKCDWSTMTGSGEMVSPSGG